MALKKTEFEKDVVYLVQFNRVKYVPSLSPYCLKLETWLRMADIKYENVDGALMSRSKKGQIPYVELNGEQIADSRFIIDSLTELYHKEDMESHLSGEQAGTAQAFEALFEELLWVLLTIRLENKEKFFVEPMLAKLSATERMLKKPFVSYFFGNTVAKKLWEQGMGRHSKEEVLNIAKKDLRAVSNYLGKKKFMTGDKATRLDASAFGHLCELWFLPEGFETDVKKFIGSDTPNLIEYMERMKSIYWPDWDEARTTLRMDTKWKVNEEKE